MCYMLLRVTCVINFCFYYLYKECYWRLYCCSLSLSLSSSVFVPNRLMMIICAHPPVCAVHALIGACSLGSSTKMAERAWRMRGTCGVSGCSALQAHHACCTLCLVTTMFPELMISLIISYEFFFWAVVA